MKSLLYTLMDEELLDCNGERCGRVDEIEVEDGFDGPVKIVALLSGGGAKSRYLGGWVHRLSLWLHHLLGLADPIEPIRIEWGLVERVDDSIHLKVTARELGLDRMNRAVAERFISRIPGACK